MGFSFPLANAIIQRAEQSVGRRAGILYLANTAGAVCGSLAAGFILLPLHGLQQSATILMSNHSEFDDAWDRGSLIRLRRTGEPHPYELANDAVQRYFTMTSECAMAAREKLSAR